MSSPHEAEPAPGPGPGSLEGRVALITGGAGAIGREIGRTLSAHGAVALLADLPGGQGCDYTVDVREERSCSDVVGAVLGDHGRLDLLVNNAGVMVREGPLEATSESWSEVLDTNLTGTFRMCRAAFEALRASDAGCIVNVSSTHAHLAARGSTAYSVSKAGVDHLTRLLALEWAEHGIRVNAVAPTVVPSAMTEALLGDREYVDRKLSAIPLGRPVGPEEVAAAVAYAGSAVAASLTGQVIVLDGGEGLA